MPNQYQLLRHAVTLADQLEAAGLPEVDSSDVTWPEPDESGDAYKDEIGFEWYVAKGHVVNVIVRTDGHIHWAALPSETHGTFRISDPLPPELIAAIKATERDHA